MKQDIRNKIEEQYGSQSSTDNLFTKHCRLLQSWYRVEVLKQASYGPWRVGGRPVGSVLVDGEQTGANFITCAAFAFAKEKVAQKRGNRDLTIDEYRLFNNMLSSQPMCFNLFSDLRDGIACSDPVAQRIVAAMFNESRIKQVDQVDVEMIPQPTTDYIGDKTAFDAAILFTDIDGTPGIASVETKYTDHLGKNAASKDVLQWQFVRKLDLLTHEGVKYYEEHKFDQVIRNLMLTLAYAQKHQRLNAINYVVALENDDEARLAVDELRTRLAAQYKNSIMLLPLQVIVERGLAVANPEFADILDTFQRRYLDFSPVEAIMNG